MRTLTSITRFAALCLCVASASAAQTPPLTPDVPPHFAAPTAANDYVKRDVMIPMRDGVKLLHRDRRAQGRAHTRRSS